MMDIDRVKRVHLDLMPLWIVMAGMWSLLHVVIES